MPYEIKPIGDEKYEVVNKDSGRVVGTHEPPDAKAKAERQVKLLHSIEEDPEWEAAENG